MEPISCKKPFHVIFCRNVMIYFDPPTKADLARRLADVLVPGGYLFVGHTEAIAPTNGLAYLAPSIYVKESRNDAVPKD